MILAQFLCPSCGSEYFLTSKKGPETIYKIAFERVVQFIQSSARSFSEGDIDLQNICCGSCNWQRCLDELVESHRD